MEAAALREAKASDVHLVSLAADRETDVERQYQIIENLIQQRVDAILLAPSGSKELVPAIRKANDAGIPVLLIDTRIDEAAAQSMGAEVLTYIGSDNFEGGAVAGRYLAEALGGSGNVAIIEGISGHETADQRRLGFLDGIAAHPGVRVVASQTANWERALAYNVAENLLQAHPELDAVFAANDEMALGALEAIAAAGRLDSISVIGFDAIPDALENIRSGRMLGSVAQFSGEMGRLGVLHAAAFVREGQTPAFGGAHQGRSHRSHESPGIRKRHRPIRCRSGDTVTGTAPLLLMRGIHKRFPGVQALQNVDLDVDAGEVHVLLGENGAGKSTLMKVLCGQYVPDAGSITFAGQLISPESPLEAENQGLIMIHQELNLIPGLTVAENIFLGHEPTRGGLIRDQVMRDVSSELLQRVQCRVDPDTPVSALSVAEQQLVEIARALREEARLLVMDEPTAALADSEIENLFEVIRDLCRNGVPVIYISHRMREIFSIGSRVTVMRDGRTVGTRAVADTDVGELIRLMVGRTIDEHIKKREVEIGNEILEVENLGRRGDLAPTSLSICSGEILGVAGLMGSGRTELARAIFGADPVDSGTVRVCGKELPGNDPAASIAAGLGFLTEDRKQQGLVLQLSVADNITLTSLDEFSRHGVLDLVAERERAGDLVETLHIRVASLGSGGRGSVGRESAEGGARPVVGRPLQGVAV